MARARKSPYDVKLIATDCDARGWTQLDLARFAEISHWRVNTFLTGKSCSRKTARAIAMALGQPLDRYVIALRSKVPA